MAEEGARVQCRAFDAWNRGDLDGWVALWDPQCHFVSAMAHSVEGERFVYHGHEGLRRFWRESHEAWESMRVDVEEMDEADEVVVSRGCLRVKGKGSGVELEEGATFVTVVHDGRIVRSRTYLDHEEGLRAGEAERARR